MTVTEDHLIEGFRDLGIRPALRLMVHSSLSSFGDVAGGAATVINALMTVLTSAGTLMMPSFCHGSPFGEGGSGYFDPLNTPTTNGIIPDHFWRMPGVFRSLNPTHPFAAWGTDAERYTRMHHRTLTLGANSPLGMLWRDGGWCLLVGVDYRVNTFHHVVEMVTGAQCLGHRTESYPIRLSDGRRVDGRTWSYRSQPCPIDDTPRYGNEMHRRQLHRQRMVGKSRLTFFRLQDCFALISELLREGYDNCPPCSRCPVRPRINDHTVLSDWDDRTGTLFPTSSAHDY